jgi:peptidoglycan-N-acetylglucosamine deacetylase
MIRDPQLHVSGPRSFIAPLTRLIYLTFDDGPHLHLTPNILQVLRVAKAKVTFFVVGERLKRPGALSVIAQAIADGHAIGNHSLTHRDLTRCSEKQIELELSDTARLLRPLGIEPKIFRPPYGRLNKTVVAVSRRLGYQIVLWDNDPRDWALTSQPVKWISAAIRNVQRRAATTIVCHDTKETTAKHLSQLLTNLKEKGYVFASWAENGKLIPADQTECEYQQQRPTISTLDPA